MPEPTPTRYLIRHPSGGGGSLCYNSGVILWTSDRPIMTIRAVNLHKHWGWLRWILLLLAILHQVFFLVHTSRLGWDELVQLAQARNVLIGENFALATTTPADLAAAEYTVDVHFPVGYAALLALGLEFIPNPVLVDFLWQAVAAVLFFGG